MNNYYALQLSARLDNQRNIDVFSPFFAKGAIARGLLDHAARTAYFMPDSDEAAAYYEKAVSKIMKDFCLPGDRLDHAEMRRCCIDEKQCSIVKQHYENKMHLNILGFSSVGDSYKVYKDHNGELIVTALGSAGVSFKSINLQTKRILYEQPLEGDFYYEFTSFLTRQDAEAWLALIEFLENTLP